MNVFLWHVHGAWTTAFVQGRHTYYVPVLPGRGADGRGRALTYEWPDSVLEVTPAQARDLPIDVVVVQRPIELEAQAEQWLRRVPGRDIPAIYVEHNAPQGAINRMRHPCTDAAGIVLAHVTHFNELFWDSGHTRSVVIEHGVPEPEAKYRGDLPRAAVVINEPARRARVTGTDLLSRFAQAAPIDLFGMGSEELGGTDLPQRALHEELARRRVYLHPFRWTSLGLTLLEAMHMAMPVVALATTEVPRALPAAYPYVSTNVNELAAAVRSLVRDPEEATARGKECREWACEHYSLARFLADWDALLAEVAA
jgi:hypothetical protein